MLRKVPQEACGTEGDRRRAEEIRQIDARGSAAAQILILTRTIDNKVTDVGNKVMDVGDNVMGVRNTLNDVDGKMDVVVKGMSMLNIQLPNSDCTYVG